MKIQAPHTYCVCHWLLLADIWRVYATLSFLCWRYGDSSQGRLWRLPTTHVGLLRNAVFFVRIYLTALLPAEPEGESMTPPNKLAKQVLYTVCAAQSTCNAQRHTHSRATLTSLQPGLCICFQHIFQIFSSHPSCLHHITPMTPFSNHSPWLSHTHTRVNSTLMFVTE